ncbi:Sec-independent protein translocase protein TatB [Qipengyuania atrilutea]|uniref:Sec-independent protein translocase protein TatB n=1 Tax=Qipengyuania atrilutea TaxID=2744473 RepID=A0A850H4P7_9SPHN|nr:Sec-independent protein translocase protein TatB [Actirhodobacter atriluteus]NVD45477.1 twin-arginine translocase subunit TatB [Actirhodobacter atriluteus]
MFDIGAFELLIIVIVAILVIGPKDMPAALRQAGRWIGKARRMSAHFRSGIDAMIREAEIEDMEKQWKARNAEIMAKYPDGEMMPKPIEDDAAGEKSGAEARLAPPEKEADRKAAKVRPVSGDDKAKTDTPRTGE